MAQLVKNPPALQETWPGLMPGLGRWERLPTPVIWPREFQGLYNPWGCKESDTTEWLSLSHSLTHSMAPHRAGQYTMVLSRMGNSLLSFCRMEMTIRDLFARHATLKVYGSWPKTLIPLELSLPGYPMASSYPRAIWVQTPIVKTNHIAWKKSGVTVPLPKASDPDNKDKEDGPPLCKQSNLARVQSTGLSRNNTENTVKGSELSVETHEQAAVSSFTASPPTGWYQTVDWSSGGHLNLGLDNHCLPRATRNRDKADQQKQLNSCTAKRITEKITTMVPKIGLVAQSTLVLENPPFRPGWF